MKKQDDQSSGDGRTPGTTRLQVNDADVAAGYANFCRVTGTPEEVLLDFGLNAHPFGEAEQTVRVSHRIALNYYTAKRMLAALHVTVRRHEEAFGSLEVDVQKRVNAGGGQG